MPMDSGVPAAATGLLLRLKDGLAKASDSVLACQDLTTTPAVLQKKIAALLPAIRSRTRESQKPPGPDNDTDKPTAGMLGNDITVEVTLASSDPRILQVVLSSSEPCGTDSQLLLYQPEGNSWQRVMRWSAPLVPEKKPGNDTATSFGDFFVTAILPGASPQDWRAVVAHGTPWCTSRFSGFGIAVLAPSSTGAARVVWQADRGYSRGDFPIRLKVVGPNTFEFRTNVAGFGTEEFERTAVYRYRVRGDHVERVEPIAVNGRGFVDEWLESPWEEAVLQTAMSARSKLQIAHTLYAQQEHEKTHAGHETYIEHTNGPVLACAEAKTYQVQMNARRNILVVGKPGGDTQTLPKTFFTIRETGSGYEMVSVSGNPNPRCAGPDLMLKH
ncbi:MAG TPA: hypothetical protein VGN16_06310 [Acidobacteriaceae bacterium]